MVQPWENDVYIMMELTGAVYKVQGTGSEADRTQTLANTAKADIWFDVYDAIDQATQLAGKGPARKMDISSLQHSGLRKVIFHPSFTNGTGYVYTSHLEVRPGTYENSDGVLECDSWDEIPSDWVYIGDFIEAFNYDKYACGEAVVAEWKFVNNEVQVDSYRQLIRMDYGYTEASFADYEHPLKQMAFIPGTTEILIESGDGSVDSKVAFGGQGDHTYGKILRIDVGEGGGADFEYTIPQDNYNFFNPGSTYPDEVCNVGFRNPHSIGLIEDPESDYYQQWFIFDGGRDNSEEVNVGFGCGGNYGWSNRDGIWVQYDDLYALHYNLGPLPDNEADFNYTYPVAMFGHDGGVGSSFTGQCGVGSHPIETESNLKGYYYYSDFPTTGVVYFSLLEDMMQAVVKVTNDPAELTQAPTYQSTIRLYDDLTKYKQEDYSLETDQLLTLAQLRRADVYEAWGTGELQGRTDMRFGKGIHGELLVICKRTGDIWVVIDSIPTDLVDAGTGTTY